MYALSVLRIYKELFINLMCVSRRRRRRRHRHRGAAYAVVVVVIVDFSTSYSNFRSEHGNDFENVSLDLYILCVFQSFALLTSNTH